MIRDASKEHLARYIFEKIRNGVLYHDFTKITNLHEEKSLMSYDTVFAIVHSCHGFTIVHNTHGFYKVRDTYGFTIVHDTHSFTIVHNAHVIILHFVF